MKELIIEQETNRLTIEKLNEDNILICIDDGIEAHSISLKKDEINKIINYFNLI